jgi:DNA-binding transcriptional LysR family regulator
MENDSDAMTLQQFRYITTAATAGTLSEAAKQLYITQPTLTVAIQELEEELGITIFNRTNRGVSLSAEGEEFLGYVRQVMEQLDLIREQYLGGHPVKHQFCVSTQHYSFAVEAFVALLRKYGGEEYDFRIRETQTYEIIADVAGLRSEIGVLYLNGFNEQVLRRTLQEKNLVFTRLFVARPHVFVGAGNPLATREAVTMEDLEPFPRLSYEQGEHNSFYFSEEIQSTRASRKDIMVSDRATLFNLLIGLDGYTICSGVINEKLNGRNIVAIPLLVDDYMEIGYIHHRNVVLSRFSRHYIGMLQKYTTTPNA